jgi:hypothetical protein
VPALAAVGAAAARVAARRPRVAVVAVVRRAVVDAARRRPLATPDVLAAAVLACPLPDARRRRVPVAAEVELADVVLLEALRGRPRVARAVVVPLAGRAGAVVLDPDVVAVEPLFAAAVRRGRGSEPRLRRLAPWRCEILYTDDSPTL